MTKIEVTRYAVIQEEEAAAQLLYATLHNGERWYEHAWERIWCKLQNAALVVREGDIRAAYRFLVAFRAAYTFLEHNKDAGKAKEVIRLLCSSMRALRKHVTSNAVLREMSEDEYDVLKYTLESLIHFEKKLLTVYLGNK